jgi:hypothetical protein
MTARATVAGERGDAIESPGVARRAAMYRTLFGVCLVMVMKSSLKHNSQSQQ